LHNLYIQANRIILEVRRLVGLFRKWIHRNYGWLAAFYKLGKTSSI